MTAVLLTSWWELLQIVSIMLPSSSLKRFTDPTGLTHYRSLNTCSYIFTSVIIADHSFLNPFPLQSSKTHMSLSMSVCFTSYCTYLWFCVAAALFYVVFMVYCNYFFICLHACWSLTNTRSLINPVRISIHSKQSWFVPVCVFIHV